MKKISGRWCEYCRQEGQRRSAVYDVGDFLYLCTFHAAPWLVKASDKAPKLESVAGAGGETVRTEEPRRNPQEWPPGSEVG